jgi:hypothetical protein
VKAEAITNLTDVDEDVGNPGLTHKFYLFAVMTEIYNHLPNPWKLK